MVTKPLIDKVKAKNKEKFTVILNISSCCVNLTSQI